MSDVSNTSDLIGRLRSMATDIDELLDDPESLLDIDDVAAIINEAADALAARVPVQGEPNDDRARIEASNQIANIVFDEIKRVWPDLHPLLDLRYGIADRVIDEFPIISRATVPDAATEKLREASEADRIRLGHLQDNVYRLEAERDAATAAVERVRAEVRSATLGLNEPIDDWNEALDYLAKKVLAALDGAPEPEEKR